MINTANAADPTMDENYALVPFEFSYNESLWDDFVNVLALHYARLVAKMAKMKYRENNYLDGHRTAFLDAMDLAYYVADENVDESFKMFAAELPTMKDRTSGYHVGDDEKVEPGSFEDGFDRAVADITRIVNAVTSGNLMDYEDFKSIERYLSAP